MIGKLFPGGKLKGTKTGYVRGEERRARGEIMACPSLESCGSLNLPNAVTL